MERSTKENEIHSVLKKHDILFVSLGVFVLLVIELVLMFVDSKNNSAYFKIFFIFPEQVLLVQWRGIALGAGQEAGAKLAGGCAQGQGRGHPGARHDTA